MSGSIGSNWMDNWMAFTANSEPCALWRAWAGLSALSGAMRRHCWLRWDGEVWPNQFVVLVGPPAARKGTAMRPVREVLEEAGVWVASDKITASKLVCAMRDKPLVLEGMPGEYEGPPISCPVTVLSDEFTVFIGYRDDEFLDNLCDLYESKKRWTYETHKHGEVVLDGVCMNILAGTTPRTLCDALPQRAIGGGFTSRTMLVFAPGPGKKVIDPRKSGRERQLRGWLVEGLRRVMELRGEFEVTPEWEERYEVFYKAQEGCFLMEDPNFEYYVGRRQVHLQKMAMAFAVADGVGKGALKLTGEVFGRAEKLLKETEARMPQVFHSLGGMSLGEIRKRVLGLIARLKEVPVALIYEKFSGEMGTREIEDLLGGLQQVQAIRVELKGMRRWVVYTPLEYEQFAKTQAQRDAEEAVEEVG